MIKHVLLISSLMLLPMTVANANWYGGINLGMNSVNISKNLTYPIDSLTPSVYSYNSGYDNFHAQLLAGLRFSVKEQVNLALEGDVDWYTGNASATISNWFITTSAGAKEQLDYGFGLFALADYQYNENFRVFAGPGIRTSKFLVNSLSTGGNLGITSNTNKWLSGWGVKVGMANQLNSQVELVLSYQYNQYKSTSWTTIEPLSVDALTGKYKPQASVFMIGIQYHV